VKLDHVLSGHYLINAVDDRPGALDGLFDLLKAKTVSLHDDDKPHDLEVHLVHRHVDRRYAADALKGIGKDEEGRLLDGLVHIQDHPTQAEHVTTNLPR